MENLIRLGRLASFQLKEIEYVEKEGKKTLVVKLKNSDNLIHIFYKTGTERNRNYDKVKELQNEIH